MSTEEAKKIQGKCFCFEIRLEVGQVTSLTAVATCYKSWHNATVSSNGYHENELEQCDRKALCGAMLLEAVSAADYSEVCCIPCQVVKGEIQRQVWTI